MDFLRVAICVIGRNEGRRLQYALESVRSVGVTGLFVDSASTDDSLAVAERFSDDIEVLALGAEENCTAALARNRGFRCLTASVPGLEFVQFMDGDCALAMGWLDIAIEYLRSNPDVGIVAGRLRETDRNRNRYHRIADMEWNTSEGDVYATGGICIVRVDAYEEVAGMNAAIARGEEADLARRVRARGHRVVRLPDEMARHDIDMCHFSQWWWRSVRYGRATAEEFQRDGLASRSAFNRVLSILAWGLFLPLVATGFALLTHGWSLALFGLYLVLWVRVRVDRLRRGDCASDANLYATYIVLGKSANACGVMLSSGAWLRSRLGSVLPPGKSNPSRRAATLDSVQPAVRGDSLDPASPRPQEAQSEVNPAQQSRPWTAKSRVRSSLIRGASALGVLNFFEARMARGLTTLMYHRVLPDEHCKDYPLGSLVIPVSAFKQQMRYIAEQYEAGTITEGLRALARGGLSRPRVAISFDDGYWDNFEIAAPILEDYGLCATFFATTDFVSTGQLMWFDEACVLFRGLGAELACASFAGDAPIDGTSLMAWMSLLKSLTPSAREESLGAWRDELKKAAGDCSLDSSMFAAMKPAHLQALHARGHEIGSHTCSHPLLPQLSPEEVDRELTKSRMQIEEWIGAHVEGFCYPNGDNDARIQRAVCEAGYDWACTTNAGLFKSGAADFALPRVGITSQHVLNRYGNHDEGLFRAQVCRFWSAMQHPWS